MRVGYLAQDPRSYDHMTAHETLRFTARFFYRGPSRALKERIAETIDLVGLTAKADQPIKGFSGGERQCLGIARRLCAGLPLDAEGSRREAGAGEQAARCLSDP